MSARPRSNPTSPAEATAPPEHEPAGGPIPPLQARDWRTPVVLGLALLVTGLLVASFVRALQAQERSAFEFEVGRTTASIQERIATTITLLRGTAGLFHASDDVELEEFRAYVARLLLREEYPGVLGIGFTRRIAPGDVRATEAQLRAGGQPGFRVWPDTPRDEYHAIVYLEPLDARNRAAIGYDMATEPTRGEAMRRARESGQPTASGPVTLVQEILPEKQAGFLIYVPIYAGVAPAAPVAPDAPRLLGFVYSPLRVGDLLAGIGGHDEPRLDIDLFDIGSAPATLMLSTAEGDPDAPRFIAERRIDVAGRPWLLRFSSRPAFERIAQWRLLPWLAAAAIVASLLLGAITRAQVRARRAAEAAAAERRRHVAVLRESDRRKDEFLATLAHELRNPLAPIRSALDILRRQPHGPHADRARDVADRQVRHMVRLVDDLLDLSRISRGTIVLQRQPVWVAEVVEQALEASRPAIEERRHQLSVHLDRSLAVDGDATRLAQVFANLLNNAARYTEPGGRIVLRCAREGDTARVTVSDTGHGIDPAQLPLVFDMFVQAGAARRQDGGLGIGLTLVRQLVELHGGQVEAHSAGLGHGSTFAVCLPLTAEAPSASAHPAGAARSLARLRVLLVDDNVDAAEQLAGALALDGHEVRTAHDGATALAQLPAFDPQLVLLDIGLPDIDGYEVARRIRRAAGGSARRIVAITGWGQERDRERAREAGFDLHLTKPVGQSELGAALAQLFA